MKDEQWKVRRLLKPRMNLEVLCDINLMKDLMDIRRCNVLDVLDDRVIVEQPEPSFLEAMIGRRMEASFITMGTLDRQPIRWGWAAQFGGLLPYRLASVNDEPGNIVRAARLDIVGDGFLARVNLRRHYRVSSGVSLKVKFKEPGDWQGALVEDLSSGGLMVRLPSELNLGLGQHCDFILNCSLPGKEPQDIDIRGHGVPVWIAPQPETKTQRIGIQFHDSVVRAMGGVVNVYMREESRLRLAPRGE